jgi:hypothetical protein
MLIISQALKERISNLRLISRVISTILSFAVFIPLAMTVHKFLSTKDVYRLAPDPSHPGAMIMRTAWAKDSKAWPTYMYFAVATTSLVLHISVLSAYFISQNALNRAAKANTIVSGLILFGNLTIWVVTVAVYRHEKDLNGKHNDLWGWTCSGPAKALQHIFEMEVKFDAYCNIQVSRSHITFPPYPLLVMAANLGTLQSSSFYLGLLQTSAIVFTGLIYALVAWKVFSKKKIKKRQSTLDPMGN